MIHTMIMVGMVGAMEVEAAMASLVATAMGMVAEVEVMAWVEVAMATEALWEGVMAIVLKEAAKAGALEAAVSFQIIACLKHEEQ